MIHDEKLASYYFSIYSSIDEFSSARFDFDSNGVLRVGGKHSHYNPSSISHFLLSSFQAEKFDEAIIRANIEWLIKNFDPEEKTWLYRNDFPRYRVFSPWRSAMAHGLVLSSLVRAAILYPNFQEDVDYVVRKAWAQFSLRISEGGVLSNHPNHYFFEEYCAKAPIMVLNGHLYAWFGLLDVVSYFKKQNDRGLREKTVEVLLKSTLSTENIISHFDTGWWSFYDLLKRNNTRTYSSVFYHFLHIRQLEAFIYMAERCLDIALPKSKSVLHNFKSYGESVPTKKIQLYTRIGQVQRGIGKVLKLNTWKSVV